MGTRRGGGGTAVKRKGVEREECGRVGDKERRRMEVKERKASERGGDGEKEKGGVCGSEEKGRKEREYGKEKE